MDFGTMMDIIGILIWILVIFIGVVFATVVGLIIYARWNYGALDSVGIPVVKPHWFLGSNPDAHKRIHPLLDLERAKQYGPVYGVYEGRQPTIYISDPKLLRVIQSKDFENFRNHRAFLFDDPVFNELLDFLDDEKWKVVRSALTPHFTTGKIKQMSETISDIALDYVTTLKNNTSENVTKMEFSRYAPPMVLEIIGKVFCGITIENAKDPDNAFVKNMKQCLDGDDIVTDWTFTLASAVPILTKFVPVFPPGPMKFFTRTISNILDARDTANTSNLDMVNTLLEMSKKSETDPDYQRLGITKTTAIGQAFEFFIASYQAVKSVLSFTIYYLATEPEIQARVRREVDDVLSKLGNKRINWETVADMPYLTACLTESMRMQPNVFRLDRRCTKEHEGIKIKKDSVVIFPLFAVHRDPTSYPDPDTFDPERFMPGRKEEMDPYTFQMFGNGPRACIGQRFGFEMLKIILVHYVKEFVFEKRSDTELSYIKGNPLFLQTKPIYVNFVKRV